MWAIQTLSHNQLCVNTKIKVSFVSILPFNFCLEDKQKYWRWNTTFLFLKPSTSLV